MHILVNRWINKIKQLSKVAFRFLRSKETLLYFGFVGLSTILWWGHAMDTKRDATIKIPIIYKGLRENVVLTESLPSYLSVDIHDNGKLIRETNSRDLSITLDLEHEINQPDGTITISSETLRNRLKDILSGTTNIQHLSPDHIVVNYYQQYNKRVPIKLIGEYGPAPEHQITKVPILDPCSIMIYGRKEIINNITMVNTLPFELNNIRDTVQVRLGLDSIANARLAVDSVNLTLYAERYTEKKFTLPINILDVPNNCSVRLFPSHVTISVRVAVEHFNLLQASDFRAICSYPIHSSKAMLPVEVKTSNPYVTNIRINPSSVEYLISTH